MFLPMSTPFFVWMEMKNEGILNIFSLAKSHINPKLCLKEKQRNTSKETVNHTERERERGSRRYLKEKETRRLEQNKTERKQNSSLCNTPVCQLFSSHKSIVAEAGLRAKHIRKAEETDGGGRNALNPGGGEEKAVVGVQKQRKSDERWGSEEVRLPVLPAK